MIKDYLLARLPELSSRVAGVITLAPVMLDLDKTQTFIVFAVAVILFGVPEDKFRR